MTYRVDGTTFGWFCSTCERPLWNEKRALKHSKKYTHFVSGKKTWKKWQFPRKGANAGEKNGTHKLTWPKVRRIREYWARNDYSSYQLARIFKVRQGTIWFIISNKTWKHI